MRYEHDVIELMVQIGDAGLPLQSIVKHIHNANNSLFEPISEQSVYQAVRSYLIKNSQTPHSLFLKGEDKKYRLNRKATQAQQLVLQFTDEEEAESTTETTVEEPLLPFDFS